MGNIPYRDKTEIVISRKGRFLKKNSPLYKACRILDYDFDSLKKVDVVHLDNPKGTIIHSRFHDEIEIEKAFSQSNGIDDPLEDRSTKMPVIMPRNFTDDWLEEKRKAKRRNSKKFDDDDELEMEIEEEERKKIEIKKITLDIPINEEEKIEEKINFQEPKIQIVEELTKKKENFDDQIEKKIEELENQKKNLEILKDTSIKTGYAEGYESGEKKAILEFQERKKEYENNFNKIIDELSQKKREVLGQAKSEFEKIVRIVSESILEREIRNSPEEIEKIIQRAISESMLDDDFIVYVSKNFYEEIIKNGSENFVKKIKIDSHLDDYKFRIESKLSSIESGVKDLVEDLVKKAGIHLFEEDKN